MNQIADFTDNEMWVIHTTVIHKTSKERYGEEIETQMAESEQRLYSADKKLTVCPTNYWEHEQCHFVVFKPDDHRYRCQYFYRISSTIRHRNRRIYRSRRMLSHFNEHQYTLM